MSGASVPARRARPTGWWGVLLLIATEAALIGALIASYFYLRFETPGAWPPKGISVPGALTPALLTAMLVVTSVPMLAAARAAAAGAVGRTRGLLLFAFAVQGAYLAIQLHEYAGELDKHDPHDGAYSSIYYTLLGAHHAHVAVGLLLIAGILIKLRTGVTRYRAVGVRSIALYWHFTNAVAIAVLLTQLSPRL